MNKLILIILGLFAVVGISQTINFLSNYWFRVSMEAEKHNKQIEYGMFLLTGAALLISIISLVYSVYKIDKLEESIKQLEQNKTQNIDIE
jgi:hypothetical protein